MATPPSATSARRHQFSVRLPPHQTNTRAMRKEGRSRSHSHSPSHSSSSGELPTPQETPQPPPESVLLSRHAATSAHAAAATHSAYGASDLESEVGDAASWSESPHLVHAQWSSLHATRKEHPREGEDAELASDCASPEATSPVQTGEEEGFVIATATVVPSPSAAAPAPAPSSSPLLTALAWASLLVAVFSMSAVGPTFLYLAKRGISPVRAVLWRQTVQCLCLLVPAWLEHRWAKPGEQAWWRKRVLQDEEVEAEREQAKRRLQGGGGRRRGGYESAPTAVAQVHAVDEDALSLTLPSASDGDEEEVKTVQRGRSPWLSLAIISCCWFISVSLWVIALPYTSAARASLFSSLYPLLIILYLRFWRRVPVSVGEFAGVGVCVLGIAASEWMASMHPDENTMAAVEARRAAEAEAAAGLARQAAAGLLSNGTVVNGTMASLAPAIVSTASVTHLQFVGDLLCVLGSCFIGANVVESGPTRKVVPLFAYSLVSSVAVWFLLLLFTVGWEGTTLSLHPLHGAFGWMSEAEMCVRIVVFGFLVGMVGILGFNYAVRYVSPIIFSTVQLLDPGLAGIMSALAGVEGWPVGSTYVGVALVTMGIFLVVLYQTKRETAAELAKEERARKEAAMGGAIGGEEIEAEGGPTCTDAHRAKRTADDEPDGIGMHARHSAYARVEMQEITTRACTRVDVGGDALT